MSRGYSRSAEAMAKIKTTDKHKIIQKNIHNNNNNNKKSHGVCVVSNVEGIFFFDGYCSTVQGLLDWFEVDLGFTWAFIYSNRMSRVYSRLAGAIRNYWRHKSHMIFIIIIMNPFFHLLCIWPLFLIWLGIVSRWQEQWPKRKARTNT